MVMYLDFMDLNASRPKDPYLLPYIDPLIEGSLGYYMLNFMDAYSEYKSIWMDPLDAPKIFSMSNHDNYYYSLLPFGLKNVGAIY